MYKAEIGDDIDLLMADFMNSNHITDINVKRINLGYYHIGQNFVAIKCIKEKLAVLTGGGYTSIEEYI